MYLEILLGNWAPWRLPHIRLYPDSTKLSTWSSMPDLSSASGQHTKPLQSPEEGALWSLLKSHNPDYASVIFSGNQLVWYERWVSSYRYLYEQLKELSMYIAAGMTNFGQCVVSKFSRDTTRKINQCL